MNKKDAVSLRDFLANVLKENLTIKCLTCNELFLDMPYGDYIALLNGDYNTTTKWYNKVVLHFCNNPDHLIMSNRHPTGLTEAFNFTEALLTQLSDNNIPVNDLLIVAQEKEKEEENKQI